MELISEFIDKSQVLSSYQKMLAGFAPILAYTMAFSVCLGIVQIAWDIRKHELNYYSHLLDTVFGKTTALPYHHLTIGFLAGAFTVWILS